ncbi:MAG: hypothetical protein ACXWAY_05160 [Acidimicrobiia bacterium]
MSATATAAGTTPALGERARYGVELAITKRAFKQLWISASVCALAFGGTAAASALSYVSTFSSEASRRQLVATTSTDRGLAVLFGPISAVNTVGGYTVYKCFVFLTTIGAVWALLASTRLLRGEEDAGRWQLMLSGTTRASRATAATLGALALAVGVIFAGTALLTLLAGGDPDVGFGIGDSMLYGLSIAIAPVVFAGVGAVTSQLCRTRRAATGLGMVVLGAAFVIRMVADTGTGTQWMLWATPFGWTELIRPFTQNDLRPLAVAAVATVVLGGAAVTVAAHRDAGDGLLASRDVAPVRPFGLRSSFGMAARLELPVLGAWCAGAAVCGVVFGIIAKMTTAKVPVSLKDALDRFGVHGGFATQYLGVVFLFVATVVALLPAGQVGAACEEEMSGRLAQLLAGPTRRTAWFVSRLALSGAGIVAAGLLAGLGAWLGARSQGVELGLSSMIGAGLNVVPTALVALGIGAVVLSVAPRAAAGTIYAVITWSLIVDLLASMVSSVSWLEHASLLHYMSLAPAQDPTVQGLAVTTAIALALCLAATMIFGRRDVRSG